MCALLLMSRSHSNAQQLLSPLTSTSLNPDTLYYSFEDEIQLIVINTYDVYRRYGQQQDMLYPRGGSWFMDNPEALPNAYIFRNRKGEITHVYNRNYSNLDSLNLRDTGFINTKQISHHFVEDYAQLFGHFKIFGPDNKVGLINRKGEVVAPTIYDDIRKLYGYQSYTNKLLIVKDAHIGLLNKSGKVIFPPIYTTFQKADYVRSSELVIDGKNLKVFKDDRCGLINQEGDVLIDFQYDDIRLVHDSTYLATVKRPKKEITHHGNNYMNKGYEVKSCVVFDRNFKQITKLEDYEYILYFNMLQLIVKRDGKFGLLNHLGEVIIPLEYESLTSQDGVYYVRKEGKMGVFSLNGDVMMPCEFEQIEMYGSAIYTIKNGLTGVFNRQFQRVADHQFIRRHWDMGKYILTRTDGSKGFVHHEKDNTYYQSPEGEIIKLRVN
ncbi:MAG: WG repeat-containing protein [Fluviicola sp.]